MLKQGLTLNQYPKQSGRTRRQNCDEAMDASDDRAWCEKQLHAVLFLIPSEG